MNRAYILNLIIEGNEDNIKIAKDICENTWKCKVTPTAILSKYEFLNSTHLYEVFKVIIKLLFPTDILKITAYYSSIRKCIINIFDEQYTRSDINQETISDLEFIHKEVPKYLKFVRSTDIFFKHLWNCLKQCGFDEDVIGITWVAFLSPSI